MTIWGPWQPYVQTLTSLPLDMFEGPDTRLGCGATFSARNPFDAPAGDYDTRTCGWHHVIAASGGSWLWTPGVDSCPVITPGSSYGSGLGYVGLSSTFSSAGGLYQVWNLFGGQNLFGVKVDTTIGIHGLPQWADPANASPVLYDYDVYGRLIEYQYQFTSVDGEVGFSADPGTVVSADRGFDVRAKRIDYSATGWQLSGGATDFTLSVATGGALTATGSFVIPDMTIGHKWMISASVMEAGAFAFDDPGPSLAAHVNPHYAITVNRRGLRRHSMHIAPPLHQRQRTDGLGGGPPHAGRNMTSRQLSGFGRGTL